MEHQPKESVTSLERLQKIIAQAGIASRREAERLILDGKVRVNGKILRELGSRADPHRDKIEVHGQRITKERRVYLLLNKPRGTVTTRVDPEGRPTVLDLVSDISQRVFPVGRLDYNTNGVLLLTNDGEMSQALSHPKAGVPRIYRVKVTGTVTPAKVEQLRKGVDIGDGIAKGYDVFVASSPSNQMTIQITLKEGRYHQIHRMMEAVGLRVSKLTRISFAGITTEGLRPSKWRFLGGREVGQLKRRYLKSYRAGSPSK